MKQCNKCGTIKPKTDFCARNTIPSGIQSYCKLCTRSLNNANHDKTFRTLRGHVSKIVTNIKYRAKANNIPFDIDVEYLLEIMVKNCPVLDIELAWCERNKKFAFNSPSLDKFDPDLGYIKGNVHWISQRANTIKSNANASEVEAVANWMKKITNGN